MSIAVTGGYGAYAAQSAANPVKTEKAPEKAAPKEVSLADYQKSLKDLVPSVEFSVGTGFSTAKEGKTLAISPLILQKMQNDPAQEKETKELLAGVEAAYNIMEAYCKATGWECVYKHSFIDENGKYRSMAFYKNVAGEKRSEEFRVHVKAQSDKMKENIKENAEKHRTDLEELIEKRKAAAAEEADKPAAAPRKDRAERDDKKTALEKMADMLDEKLGDSQGEMYLYQTDLDLMVNAALELAKGEKGAAKSIQPPPLGGNLDLEF